MVLIKDENLTSPMWPMGIITEVFPGSDGIIRNVNVKTAKGVVNRSIHKLLDLEIIHNYPEQLSTVRNKKNLVDKQNNDDLAVQTVKTRSGRNVKPVNRY